MQAQTPPLQRLLLTGAAGGLGQVLRQRLRGLAPVLRVSDIAGMGAPLDAQEEVNTCDLADKQAVDAMVAGCDAIVHLGGVSVERPFEEVLEANIKGIFHLYEAARRHGVQRIVFASSNHVIGFYQQSEKIDAHARRRPDGYYGLSKSFGEDMASFYFDRYGIETVSIRIGSSFPAPKDRRMMHSWLSYDDLVQLVEKSLFTPNVGHTVVYGASANRDLWWDNHAAAHLGFVPKDSSEPWRAQVEAQPAPAANDPVAVYQGGAFTAQGPFGDAPEQPA
ncbi:NAD(P)-dependent oxidoreductase [Comamonas sp. MYb21]|uniref:NAD-dependent epimerase/dehydratase family protein n=1 Tax=Comamonas sp. MYb21 TaxID=1848648 RepID=UPI0030A03351